MAPLLELLEWTDPDPDEMVHRYPQAGSSDIKMGAQLIVQENQDAIFFRDGKCLDALGPGRHLLSTLNLPILTRFLALPYGFQSPFRAAVFFVNRKIFTDLKWGTKNPVVFRDKDLGVVRLRGYGRFSLRIADPMVFVNAVVGSRAEFYVAEIEDLFRDIIVARLNDLLGERLTTIVDLPAIYNELAAAAKVRIRQDLRRYGLELVDFFINSVTPPDEVQQLIDQRSGMSAVADMDEYMRFQAARAVGGQGGQTAGGTAGTALEVGVGAGVGLAMVPNLLRKGLIPDGTGLPPGAAPPPGEASPAGAAKAPGAALTAGAAGSAHEVAARPAGLGAGYCSACGVELGAGYRFCPECGRAVNPISTCAHCGRRLPDHARFCPGCGEAVTRAEGNRPDAGPSETGSSAGGAAPTED